MGAAADRKLAKMIKSRGLDFGPTIIAEANRTGLPLALALALVEQESGFRNIFGCDLGPRDGVPFCHQEVNRDRVQALINHVERGGASNGVGLTQLTSIDFIKGAEKMGGAHKAECQCRFGFQLLKSLIAKHGGRVGIGAYNGGEGNPQLDYADDVIALRGAWQKRINAALKGVKDEEPTSDSAVHRDLRLTTPFTEGPDIKALQRSINARARDLPFTEANLRDDGEYGPRTQGACKRVSFALGLHDDVTAQIEKGTIKQLTQQLVREPDGRTPQDRERAQARRPILKREFEARQQGARAAVKWARQKIGVHEQPASSNWGPQIKDWITFTGYDGPVLWCGCFVAFAVVEKGGARVPERIRLGFDLHINDDARGARNGFQREVNPEDAKPGDIATFNFRHIALVAGPTKGGMIHTIDGNSSAANGSNNNGGEVAEHRRPLSQVTCVGRLRY